MPPAAKRNASVIIYDVNTRPEFTESAKKCLLNICASKWFAGSKDNTKLVLLNTQESNNSIHAKFGKCPHVSETAVTNFDPKAVKEHIDGVEKAAADWLMGLAVAIEVIKDQYVEAKGIMNIQLLFITDLSTPCAIKEKRVEFAIKNLKQLNVRLYIVGPEVKVPERLSTSEDIQQWIKNVEFVVSDNPNLSAAKQIVQATDGVICGLDLGQELFKNYYNHWGLQAWKVPLTIGSCLTMQTSTVRFLRAVAPPKFKGETLSGFKEPWKWHLVDDLLEEVAHNDVIGGVFKHDKFVALPDDVMKTFKYSGARCFKIFGFTDRRNVPEFYLRGSGSHYVESDSSKSFKLLVHILAKQNKYAIANKVYMANCRPKLVALLPNAEKGIFNVVELPFGDSIRANFVEQDVEDAPELDRANPTVDAMYNYLQKLDINDSNNRDENGSSKVRLTANLTDAIRLNLVAQRCLQKYLGNEMDLSEIKLDTPEFVDVSDYKKYVPVRVEKVKKAVDN